tara:strand:- start:331 stop:807 length:477 start_codon:yes stop_codon:yes gene_type:complete
MTSVSITLNGHLLKTEVDARTSLADLIREQPGCTATHLACEHGVCGACTILLDGKPMRSCITLAAQASDHDVVSLEGLADDAAMAVIRQAFHEAHGLQCGFCTPGMLITVRDMLARGKATDDAEIRRELSGNICRCTGYMGIVEAVKLARDRLREAPG